ncbi:MAG: AtpZ/AtpI family protein [Lachnospiraceae bacterium]|nr:AtpZ/AtpI family protein [Lachnospiraceae bacterium]
MSGILKILSFITQIAMVMLISIFGCFFIGYFLDSKLGTSFLTIVFFFIGAIGGMTGVYKLVRSTFKDND